MTYNVFSGTLNPTHFTSLHLKVKFMGQSSRSQEENIYTIKLSSTVNMGGATTEVELLQ